MKRDSPLSISKLAVRFKKIRAMHKKGAVPVAPVRILKKDDDTFVSNKKADVTNNSSMDAQETSHADKVNPNANNSNPNVTSMPPPPVPLSVNVDDSVHVEGTDDAVPKKVSYAETLQAGSSKKVANFRSLGDDSDISLEGVDVVLPLESIKKVSSRFDCTLYGYFLGTRLAFPVVENYVKNTWTKFGLNKVMMNSSGSFFFKFNEKEGMAKVLEHGL